MLMPCSVIIKLYYKWEYKLKMYIIEVVILATFMIVVYRYCFTSVGIAEETAATCREHWVHGESHCTPGTR